MSLNFHRVSALLAAVSITFMQSVHAAQPPVNPYPDFQLETITRLLPEFEHLTHDFSPSDLVVFDLDNTIFREVQMLGTDEWYSQSILNLRSISGPPEVHKLRLDVINHQIKLKTQMKLMEDGIPVMIRALQERGVRVIALTARHPHLAESTLRNLRAFGIDFSVTSLPDENLREPHVPGLKNEFLFKDGVAFTDGARKGTVLTHLLRQSGFHPQRLAAVDDRVHHVESYIELLQEMRISGLLIHYLKALEEEPFDATVAEVQLTVFIKLGILLNDQEARALLAFHPTWQQVRNWTCSRLLERWRVK